MSQLQNIEGHMKAILLALHVTEAQHLVIDSEERRQQLLRMCIKELSKLDRKNGGNGGAAMSTNLPAHSLSDHERAVNALSHRMGAFVPAHLR